MDRAVGPPRGQAAGGAGEITRPADRLSVRPSECNRCGFEVPVRAWGCKNPCPNCGTVYPLGDCSD